MALPITRRHFVTSSVQSAVLAPVSRFMTIEARRKVSSLYQRTFAKLERFAEQYMRDMNALGMTLVLADRQEPSEIAGRHSEAKIEGK
jgi:hypothetical protein